MNYSDYVQAIANKRNTTEAILEDTYGDMIMDQFTSGISLDEAIAELDSEDAYYSQETGV